MCVCVLLSCECFNLTCKSSRRVSCLWNTFDYNKFMGLSYKRFFFWWHAKWKEFESLFYYNKFMGLSYKRFFFDDMQNEKKLRSLLTTTNLWDWVISNFFWWHEKWKKIEIPFDYNKLMGLSYKQFFLMTWKMKKKLRSLLTTTNLWDWIINDVFFLKDMQNEKKLRAFLTTTNLWDWVINKFLNFFFNDMQNKKNKLRAHFNLLYI